MPRNLEFKQGTLPGISAANQPLKIVPGGPVDKIKSLQKDKAEQLAIWKTAGRIVSEYEPLIGDVHEGETSENLWARKAMEASQGAPGNSRSKTTGETLAQSIKREGIKNPVSLQFKDSAFGNQPFVLGGHHRIAASLYDNPDNLIPVTYSDTLRNADTWRRHSNEFYSGSGGTNMSSAHKDNINNEVIVEDSEHNTSS
jgi:hypothetical protein